MRYISKREDFLRRVKITESENSDFLRKRSMGVELYEELIKETYATNHGSGPMANDIGWNDSLVGRLINHMIRKAKVAANLVSIKLVISRLKGEFDRLQAESKIGSLDDEERKLFIRAMLSQFFEALKEAVEKGYKVEVIKNLTEAAIEKVKSLKDEDIDSATKAKLLDELEKFLEFLNQFDENEGEEDPDMSEEDEDDEDDEEDGVLDAEEAEKLTPSFPTMVSNLNALYGILTTYKSTVMQKAEKKSTYKVVAGDTLAKIQQNIAVNKKKLDLPTIRKKNPATAAIGDNDDLLKKNIKELVLESASINEDRAVSKEAIAAAEKQQKIAGGRTATVVGAGEDHATQALTKLNKAIASLVSDEKGVGVNAEFVKALIDNAKNTESKNLIKSLYNEINVCLKGNRKATIQDPDALYKEAYEYLKPRSADNKKGGMLPVVAEKIARFAKRAMQFDGENLYGAIGELGKNLQKFVETMKSNMKVDIVEDKPSEKKEAAPSKEEAPKKEATTLERASIGSYDKFVRMISEADEDIEASDPPSGSVSERIQDYFDKKCMTVKEYTMEKTEYDKVRSNIEKISNEKDALIIDGMDPVIEIMKLFNRAYKLYMTDFITKRSDFNPQQGRGVGTAAEYDNIGGAYRNKKIFNQWESAVSDILKNRKYQQIFSVKTKLRVGDEMRDKAGANLRKFMTDLLDGDKLYGEGNAKGAQAKLLDKYFGDPDEAAKKAEETGFAIGDDGKKNEEQAKKVMAAAIKLRLAKLEGHGLEPRSFFTIKGKNKDGTDVQRSFFVQSVDNGVAYLQYSKDFYTFNRYLSKIDGKRTIEDGETKLNYQNPNAEVKYTKQKADSKLLLTPGKVKISYFDSNKQLNEEELTIESVYWLTSKDENEKTAAYAVPKDQAEKLTKAIDEAGGVRNIVNYLSGMDKVKVEKA